MRSKGQISLNFGQHVNFKSMNFGNHVNFIFLYQTLCVFSQIKDRKHIEQNFHSDAGIMHQEWDLGVLGVKSLTWGFAMAPIDCAF